MSTIALTVQARKADYTDRHPHDGPISALEGALAETLAELRTAHEEINALRVALEGERELHAHHDEALRYAVALAAQQQAKRALAIAEESSQNVTLTCLRKMADQADAVIAFLSTPVPAVATVA
jgi:hypothetical protein